MAADKQLAFYLFGDQSLDTHAFIAGFNRRGEPSVLSKVFMERASLALRDEVEALGKLERSRLPVFRTLAQLNEKYFAQAVKHPGIDSALLTIAQLAHYIDRAEKEPHDATRHDRTFLVGSCTGLFAAAAIASTPTVSTLIPIAVQAVVLAFRLGSYVSTLADELSSATGKSESWTHLYVDVSRKTVDAELVKFHAAHGTPAASRAFITASSERSIAVSGPPATLEAIAAEGIFKVAARLPVYGPYHAAHLHSSADVDRILRIDDHAVTAALKGCEVRSAVMSSAGKWFTEIDSKSLFLSVAAECLNDVLYFQRMLDGCVEKALTFAEDDRCLVIPCGPTMAGKTLSGLLQSRTKAEVVLRNALEVSAPPVGATIGINGSTGKVKLAIVGMAGRFPDAASHELLWDLLAKGLDVHRVVPKDRFPVDTHYDPKGKVINTSHTPYGCWIENPGFFDPRFFNMSPREALQTDPMQRMAITTAFEALEMSGYVPNRTPSTRLDRVGTFYGQTSDDWREINASQEVDTYFITGGVRAFGPGRINYHFGFSGPSLNIDTACSSSAAALQVACSSLWAKECDTAIIGGLSCMTNSDIFAGLSRGQFLSKTGGCKTFDDGADGYCRADGCGSVIVKRLDDALEDRDNVLAVILGTATNHSADAISITHPHGPTQSVLSSAILDDAGVDPLDVDYVEMHGTGTQAGDGTELVSVTDVFAPAHRKRPADRPLYLGAVKANIGHGEAASGVTALIKVLMMLQKNTIPPHVGIKNEINKTFPKDLSERNVNIAFHLTPFRRTDGKPRRVFINNFSAAGGNTGLLIEDGPKYPAPVQDPRPVHVVTATGKSKAAMIRNAERLVSWMEQHPETPVSDVAYTTTARRIQHYWRMNVTASNLTDARTALLAKSKEAFTPISSEQPKVAFMFTGQGSHYAGLGKDLYAHFAVFRAAVDEFDRLASKIHGFPSFMPLIDGSEPDVQKLSPVVVQLGLCCFEMALARLWQSWGVKPAVVLGHSLGEYAALHVAGVLSASDTIYLCGVRAQLLVERCTAGTHSMLAVQGSVPRVMEALGEHASLVNVACINGPEQTVLSGSAGDVAAIAEHLSKTAGLKGTLLQVPFAFHSAQVDDILDEFERRARSARFSPPKITIISPLLGKVVQGETIDATYLRHHAREAVNFHSGLLSALQCGTIDEKTVWLEVGPHPVCAGFVKATFGASTTMVPTLRRNEATYKTLSNSLCVLHTSGLNMDWNEFHRDFSASTRLLDLPSYSFDEKNYWLQYEGGWNLTKNRAALAGTAPKAIEAPPKPKLATTSVHGITKEQVKDGIVLIETETNLSREDIRRVVTGHLCNGAPLLPSTLYADMAMTVCEYAYKLVKGESAKIGVNVAQMSVPKTLIFDETLPAHVLRCTVTANVAAGYADVVFHTGDGPKRTEHGICKAFFGETADWESEFERVSYLIKGRIDALQAAEKTGEASKIGRGLAYKLFSALVDYNPRYQGMDEVILDSKTCEATAKVSFKTGPQDGGFEWNPYWIDSCCHISGFIINGTDAVDSREQVFISHGWGSLRFVEKLDPAKTYRSYIRMQPVKGTKMMAGDAYVFDPEGKVVGVAGDIRFQSIPRRILNMVLPPRGAAAAGMSAPAKPAGKPAAGKPAAVAAAAAAAPPPKAAKQVITPSNIGAVNSRLAPRKSIVTSVLDILAKEVGCSDDELADNINFADLGVDSLMALTVSGRMREELDLDIDSHAFIDHPTIGAFKTFLAQFETAGAGADAAAAEPEPAAAVVVTGHLQAPAMDRKASSTSSSSGRDGVFSSGSDSPAESDMTTPNESEDGSVKDDGANGGELQEIVRSTIADAMGVDVDEVIAAPDLPSMGMDSLMSLTILGTLREKTGMDIDSELFTNCLTLAAVEKALGIGPRPKHAAAAPAAAAAAAPVRTITAPKPRTPKVINTHPGNTTATIVKPPRPAFIPDHYPHRKATSILLQGKASASRSLWMIPDGSGCATSYTEISKVGNDWAVWGLFSPFMKTPHEFNCGVYGIATKYIEEMRRRQPKGPYSVAGWSAGGVVAYEIVHQLTQAGERIDHLILIDSPSPVTIEPLPKTLHAWFASIGLLGEDDGKSAAKKIPEWLLPHFAASVTALSNYTPTPIPDGLTPRVVMAIWCEDGVCKLPTDPRPDPYPKGHAQFLLDNRTDFGPNRWDEYLDEDRIVTRHIPGNHFSMMHGNYAKQLGAFMNEAVTI